MIEGYAKHGQEREAIALFQKMVNEGEKPNSVTFLGVVKACSHMHDIHKCISFHVQMIETGSSAIDLFVGSALIDMYAKCNDFLKALEVFNRLSNRNVMAWNAIISWHVNSGDVWEALRLFAEMQADNISPNGITFASIVKACRLVCALEEGKIIHSAIIHHNLESDIFLKSALIDFYAKTGSCEDACKIFDDSARHELVPCNVMMRGYVHHGQYQDALQVFSQMDCNPVSKTDSFMLVNLLQVCSLTGAGMDGKLVHMFILESGFELSLFIGNALIDMYIKCGSVRDALEVLLMLKFRDIVSWSVIIAGFAATGNCAMAFHCFAQMQREGFEPNEVTFLSMFSMCNRMGALTEAPGHMHLMREFYSVKPTMDHYNVIVDALARAGLLKEANDLIRALPFALNFVGWASLLGHCSVHGNIRLAKHSFNHFVTLDNTHATGYMHMAAAICSEQDISGREVRAIS
jgi:pentatricopeptide repeat protein